jgi:hypothetical protein
MSSFSSDVRPWVGPLHPPRVSPPLTDLVRLLERIKPQVAVLTKLPSPVTKRRMDLARSADSRISQPMGINGTSQSVVAYLEVSEKAQHGSASVPMRLCESKDCFGREDPTRYFCHYKFPCAKAGPCFLCM